MIFAILLFFMSAVCITLIAATKWSQSWPTIVGEVENIRSRFISINGRSGYRTDIQYKFMLGGKVFRSNALSLMGLGLHSTEMEANEFIRGIVENKLKVFYCPLKPSICYIVSNPKLISILFWFSLASTLCGFLFILVVAR